MKKENQVKAIKKQIKNPEICLNEKVMDDIKDLSLDSEIEIKMKVKVVELSKERDYDYPMEEMEEYEEKRPKILKARFEVEEAKKV